MAPRKRISTRKCRVSWAWSSRDSTSTCPTDRRGKCHPGAIGDTVDTGQERGKQQPEFRDVAAHHPIEDDPRGKRIAIEEEEAPPPIARRVAQLMPAGDREQGRQSQRANRREGQH